MENLPFPANSLPNISELSSKSVQRPAAGVGTLHVLEHSRDAKLTVHSASTGRPASGRSRIGNSGSNTTTAGRERRPASPACLSPTAVRMSSTTATPTTPRCVPTSGRCSSPPRMSRIPRARSFQPASPTRTANLCSPKGAPSPKPQHSLSQVKPAPATAFQDGSDLLISEPNGRRVCCGSGLVGAACAAAVA